MEIQQVRYFVALCETLNFTRAAERSNVSQPSLTRAIKLLEHELGGPLFVRDRSRTRLTELGRLMQPYLEGVMEQIEGAKSQAKSGFLVCFEIVSPVPPQTEVRFPPFSQAGSGISAILPLRFGTSF